MMKYGSALRHGGINLPLRMIWPQVEGCSKGQTPAEPVNSKAAPFTLANAWADSKQSYQTVIQSEGFRSTVWSLNGFD